MALRHHRPATAAFYQNIVRQRQTHSHNELSHALTEVLLSINRPLSWQPTTAFCMRQFSTSKHREFLTPISLSYFQRKSVSTVDPSTSYQRNIDDLRKTATTDKLSDSMLKLSQIDPANAGVIHNTHLKSPAMSYENNIDILRAATAGPEHAPPPSFDFSHLHSHDRLGATEKSSKSTGGSTAGTIDENQDTDVETLRRRLMNASLPFVRELGWTQQAIAAGAAQMGESSSIHGLFQRGGIDLILFFYYDCNRRLREQLFASDRIQTAGGVNNVINRAIHERLEMLGPVIDSWPQALAMLSLPPNSFYALQALGELVDDIWYAAGDRSSDFSWYTKRASLASVYCATELYMLQDRSTGFEATWAFLDRRLRDFGMLSRMSRRMRNPFGRSTSSMDSMSSSTTTMSGAETRRTMPSPFNMLRKLSPFSNRNSTQSSTSPNTNTASTFATPSSFSTTNRFDASSCPYGTTSSGVFGDKSYMNSAAPPFTTTSTASSSAADRRDNIFTNNPGINSMRNAADQIARGNNPMNVVGEAMRNVLGAQKLPGSKSNNNKW